MTIRPTIDWKAVAEKVAQALNAMPCTCVHQTRLWPFKDRKHHCRRCISLKIYQAAMKDEVAA